MFPCKYHQNGGFSVAMLVLGRVSHLKVRSLLMPDSNIDPSMVASLNLYRSLHFLEDVVVWYLSKLSLRPSSHPRTFGLPAMSLETVDGQNVDFSPGKSWNDFKRNNGLPLQLSCKYMIYLKKNCSSWYRKYSHSLRCFIYPSWCRISSISTILLLLGIMFNTFHHGRKSKNWTSVESFENGGCYHMHYSYQNLPCMELLEDYVTM